MDKSEQEQIREPVTAGGRGRRQYPKTFKQQLIQQSRVPGASTARVAMEAGVNANLLRRWIKEAGGDRSSPQALLPVVLREAPKRTATAKAIATEAPAIEIDVNGARIRLNSRATVEQIGAVVSALRA